VRFGLDEEHPAAGPLASDWLLERMQSVEQLAGRSGVKRRRPRTHIQLTADNLSHAMGWDALQVLIRGLSSWWLVAHGCRMQPWTHRRNLLRPRSIQVFAHGWNLHVTPDILPVRSSLWGLPAYVVSFSGSARKNWGASFEPCAEPVLL
jgi:hypothetical protein